MCDKLKIISLCLVFICGAACGAAQTENELRKGVDSAFEKRIDVGGYALYINCSRAVKNNPVVVFEAGINQTSESWTPIQPEIAKVARVCVYDRASLGRSDAPSSLPRTSRQIVEDLHNLLEKAGVGAPYVLVGHSFGGLNARLFAGSYPKEVAGMVLVDSVHEEETEKWLALIPPEIKTEMEAGGGMRMRGGEPVDLPESEKQLKSIKWRTEIPLIVLARGKASYNAEDYPPPLRAFAPRGEELRIEMQKDLAKRSTRGKLIFAEKSGHFIQSDEPELVIKSILEVIEASKRR